MKRPVEDYLQALEELELLRLLSGGELDQELELAFAIKLDPLWEAIEEDDRAEVEDALRRIDPGAVGSVLEEVDVEVEPGGQTPPRRAA